MLDMIEIRLAQCSFILCINMTLLKDNVQYFDTRLRFNKIPLSPYYEMHCIGFSQARLI